ncbi:hypothetical protein ES705_41621 [subsurface metagenome]
MKIKNLENLDVGTSNIIVEGDITYAGDIKNWTGKTGKGRAYNFWGQFVVLEDDTDNIGVSLTFKKETNALEEEDHVKIRGKLVEYTDNEGEVQRKLSGRVIRNKEDKEEVTGSEKANNVKAETTGEKANNKGENKNLFIARECAIKAAVELIAIKKIKYEELFPCAEEIVKYIYEGYQKEDTEKLVKEELVEKLIKPERRTIGVEKNEIADEDIPF